MLKQAGHHIEGQETQPGPFDTSDTWTPGGRCARPRRHHQPSGSVGRRVQVLAIFNLGLTRLAKRTERVYVAAYGAPDRTAQHTDKHAHTPSKQHLQTGTHAADVSVTE